MAGLDHVIGNAPYVSPAGFFPAGLPVAAPKRCPGTVTDRCPA